jgi:AAA+ ATPase superfamily predicted ATPase
MFVGRESELKSLNNLYQSDRFEFLVLYGRRRVGKTYLLDEFKKEKKVLEFLAIEGNDKLNLDLFSEAIYAYFEQPKSTGAFTRWSDAFDYIYEQAKKEKIVLIIDEYPYAAEANKSLASMLQRAIDHQFKQTNLTLILSGSHVGFMENEVIGMKSPLFGRRTAAIRLKSFDYFDSGRMLPTFSNEDKVKFFSVLGGTPYYLSLVDANLTFEENVIKLFFTTNALLYNEVQMLLLQELRQPANYNVIIQAIATGSLTLAAISEKTGIQKSSLTRYLQTLIEMEIIKKELPYGEKPEKSRKGQYLLADNLFRFWYSFVFKSRNIIERGNGKTYAERRIFPKLSDFIGKPTFEEIALSYLNRLNAQNKLSLLPTYYGSWWGTDNVKKEPTDIDILVVDEEENQAIFGECKWRNDFKIYQELTKLLDKARLFPYFKPQYYFFSKVDFSDEHQVFAVDHHICLISLDDLFKNN